MDLNRQIESAEISYKQILEGFFVSIYKDNYLPSHGLSHHRRVWNIAKELTEVLHNRDFLIDSGFVNSLIIACYLHDIGMAVEHGTEHGQHSARLMQAFLKNNNLPESDYPGLYEAVLLHDKKDYSSPSGINLHSVLSMADDLDAFGVIGVYRYLEIYSLRGVLIHELAEKIRRNAAGRLRHFMQQMSFDENLVIKHRKRYEILETFCLNLENDLVNGNHASGYLKIVRILTSMVQSGAIPEQMISKIENDGNPVVDRFFKTFRAELANAEPNKDIK